MTVSLGSSLASEGICLFVDLWKAQPCLGDPAAVQSPTVMVQATGVKPALNWANVFFGEASWFLIGPTFLREPSWKYSSKRYSLNMFWEHSPYWTIIASDWLRAELSCG